MSSDLIGKVLLNQFRVDAFVASGGMGAVYRVWDLKRTVPLAMKVLHSELAEDPAIFKRFQREARALQKLAHPNIVQFYGLYQTLDFAFLLERFIDGPSLKDILRRQQGRPLPVTDALVYIKALCAALGYAHASSVVHCDVKPGNVMVDRGGNVYLTDFGVARHVESTTTTLGAAGTPAYMAPEQIRGEAVAPAADIYALGVVLFEMLTGQRPFRGTEEGTEKSGATAHERIRYGHLHLPPPDPRSLNPLISPALAGVILKALSKDPAGRYRSTAEFFGAVCNAANVLAGNIADRVVLTELPPARGYAPPQTAPSAAAAGTAPAPSRRLLPYALGGGTALAILCGLAVVVGLAVLFLGNGGTAMVPRTVSQPGVTRVFIPTTLPTWTPSPMPTRTPFPPFTVRPYDADRDQNTECVICRVEGWEGRKVPGSYSWNVTFPTNTSALLALGWCAVDKQTLVSNWPSMQYELIIDNYQIDLNSLMFRESQQSDRVCYSYLGVLEMWSRGRHTYVWIHHVYQAVNDGWDTYQAGDYIFKFIVDVQ